MATTATTAAVCSVAAVAAACKDCYTFSPTARSSTRTRAIIPVDLDRTTAIAATTEATAIVHSAGYRSATAERPITP